MATRGTYAGFRELRARRGRGAAAMRALDRGARSPRLVDAPVADAGAAVRALHVVVVGQGSVGAAMTDLLARSGVASLALVDRDRVGPESVLTHPVHPDAIGRAKATVAAERAKAVSPATRVLVHDGPVEALGLGAFAGADAVLLASDNLACEVEVGQRCRHLGVPLLQASVHGATLVAQVRSLGHGDTDGPCLACGYQAADWAALDRGTRYPCAGGPAEADAPPTVSPPQLCAGAASLALLELLARATGLVAPSESRLVELCGFGPRSSVTPLERRAACPCDHATWRVVRWGRPLGSASPRALFAAAGGPAEAVEAGLAELSIAVAGHRFGRLAACDCREHPRVERFRPLGAGVEPCAACGAPLEPHPLYTWQVVPGSALAGQLDRPLEALGAAAPETVLVRRRDAAALVCEGGRR